jgi:putative transposase
VSLSSSSSPVFVVNIREASRNWKSIHHWKPALQSFQVMFGEDRVPLGAL